MIITKELIQRLHDDLEYHIDFYYALLQKLEYAGILTTDMVNMLDSTFGLNDEFRNYVFNYFKLALDNNDNSKYFNIAKSLKLNETIEIKQAIAILALAITDFNNQFKKMPQWS
jgi:hypothetical protein